MLEAVITIGCVLLTAALAGGTAFISWLARRVVTLGEDVATVKAEHRNNGGSSTRDAIDRIERTGNQTRALLNDHLQQSAADSALLAQHLNQH